MVDELRQRTFQRPTTSQSGRCDAQGLRQERLQESVDVDLVLLLPPRGPMWRPLNRTVNPLNP